MSIVRDDRPAIAAWNRRIGLWLCLGMLVLAAGPDSAEAARRASPDDPEIRRAINRGMNYLRNWLRSNPNKAGQSSAAALGLLKAGEPPDTPEIQGVLHNIISKVSSGTYKPQNMEQHIYEAGVDIMTLGNADPDYYRPQMEIIAAYIISRQHSEGFWDYPQPKTGDTSISQYGMLGLWAAAQYGITVPTAVWDRAAHWHITRQSKDGGFIYHPPIGGGGSPTPSMTAAGTGSMSIARLHLYPKREPARAETASNERSGPNRTRLPDLVQRADERPQAKAAPARTTASTQQPRSRIPLEQLNKSINAGLAWFDANFSIDKVTGWQMYYLYGLERVAALNERTEFARRDWYTEGAAFLVAKQAENGSWSGSSGVVPCTAFGLLFLTQATARDLGGSFSPAPILGSGLLAGGRGLPDNLLQVQMKDGRVQSRKLVGPVDDLLANLETPDVVDIEAAQAALVESVQLGDRETLIGQKDRLIKLVRDPRVEVRRTALWALGRSEDLRIAPLLIDALADPDIDVAIEARNALCTLSRKPEGLGLSHDPWAGLKGDATDQQRKAAADAWKSDAHRKWRQWYRSIRPYDERDDLPEDG
jgi:hypothetical protein